MNETEKLKSDMLAPRRPPVDPRDLLSSGSTLLNLACSGSDPSGLPERELFPFCGRQQVGEDCNMPQHSGRGQHQPIVRQLPPNLLQWRESAYWDVEQFWGSKLAGRIEPPAGNRDAPVYPRTVQDFYFLLYDSFEWGKDNRAIPNSKKCKPFVWVEDSMSSLDEEARWDKFETNRSKAAAGKELEGSYGMGKAKVNSDNILWVVNALADTGFILIIINQTRDRVGYGAQYNPNTVGGGLGLKFYANHELWSSVTGEITRTINDKKRQIGTFCEIAVKKNSLNGRSRTVEVPIYSSFGLDDIGSCVDFLIEEKHWRKEGAGIAAPEFEHEGTREKLIQIIEEQELEYELRRITQQVWDSIEEKCKIERKLRYS